TPADIPDMAAVAPLSRDTGKVCGMCGQGTLFEAPYLAGFGLKIDCCNSCRGVFLDAFELRDVEQLARKTGPAAVGGGVPIGSAAASAVPHAAAPQAAPHGVAGAVSNAGVQRHGPQSQAQDESLAAYFNSPEIFVRQRAEVLEVVTGF